MITTTSTVETGETIESRNSGVAWAAIIGGALTAAGVSIVLSPLGVALGIGSMSPWHHMSGAGEAVSVAGAIWLVVVQWLSSGMGGYLTGRLRTKWTGAHTHEVFFRDTAHGFLSWALASVIGIGMLAAVAGHAAGGGMEAMSKHGGGNMSPEAYYTDSLFRSDQNPSNVTDQDRREATQILAMSVTKGSVPDNDLNYLTQLIASRTGISQAEAQKRVDDTVTKQKAAMDTARKAASAAAIFISLALFIGAFVASAAAALGGRDRDVHYETGRFTTTV